MTNDQIKRDHAKAAIVVSPQLSLAETLRRRLRPETLAVSLSRAETEAIIRALESTPSTRPQKIFPPLYYPHNI